MLKTQGYLLSGNCKANVQNSQSCIFFANLDKFNLIKNCYTHKTRLSHKNNFFLPQTRTRLGQKSLSFAGIKIWNEISSSLKEVSFYRFKKAVKAHFLSTYETDKS